ncbi:MAG TPA: helix-turn-helix domain-containing protein [Gemmataceae bacterium]|nr:helix-turn-helix domain-containing protein [Gemmataceae bacterium]
MRTAPPACPTCQVRITVNGVRVEVPPEVEAAVRRACEAAARPLPAEMTPAQAAEFLDVSRPFVVRLTRRGELPYRLVGRQRRIPTAALVAYRERMHHHARSAAAEPPRLSDLGLDELEELLGEEP